ncbi:SURF1 family protein [Tomitella gaofuii]|uniref:SURF1 family cytochrome oxidase biogenesis protein n=1 Tax=Tomitella gaofuii TaxID=2760083 RepID=UPI0015FBAC00|nr:SURF1 family protein [Tomitella gaofuii]
MRRLSFLLRPGWLALIALCLAFAYMCFTVLAPWQLGKNSRNSDRNDRIAASLHADPVPVGQVFDGTTAVADADEWRPVVATGTYLADKQVLVRLRSIEGDPAYEVLAPFRLDDGRTILVDRGYVRPDQQMQPPQIAPPPGGTITLDARVRQPEHATGDRPPVHEAGWTQVYAIDPGKVGALTDVDLLQGYLQLEADQPGGLGVIALPQLDSGPYLSYGLQWLAFGIMAPLGVGYFVWAELRERRLRRAYDQAVSSGAWPPPGAGPEPGAKEGSDSAAGEPGGAPAQAPRTPERSPAVDEEEFAHVMRGRRKRRAHTPMPVRTPERTRVEELPEAQRRTLAERYGKKS